MLSYNVTALNRSTTAPFHLIFLFKAVALGGLHLVNVLEEVGHSDGRVELSRVVGGTFTSTLVPRGASQQAAGLIHWTSSITWATHTDTFTVWVSWNINDSDTSRLETFIVFSNTCVSRLYWCECVSGTERHFTGRYMTNTRQAWSFEWRSSRYRCLRNRSYADASATLSQKECEADKNLEHL